MKVASSMGWNSIAAAAACFLTCVLSAGAAFDTVSVIDPCAAYGDYELITSRGVVALMANASAACVNSCPGPENAIPQIECLGGDPNSCAGSEQISSAVCIYQDVFSMKYYSCVFLNATGFVASVARYSFELEYEQTHPECVLRNSYRVWYNQDYVRQKAVLVILGISLGCAGLVFIILVTMCFFYCCRRKPRSEPLLYPADASRTIY